MCQFSINGPAPYVTSYDEGFLFKTTSFQTGSCPATETVSVTGVFLKAKQWHFGLVRCNGAHAGRDPERKPDVCDRRSGCVFEICRWTVNKLRLLYYVWCVWPATTAATVRATGACNLYLIGGFHAMFDRRFRTDWSSQRIDSLQAWQWWLVILMCSPLVPTCCV